MQHVDYLDSIKKSGLFRHLKIEDYEQVWKELRMASRKFSDHQTIYCQGDKVTRIGIVHDGLVRGEKFHEEGTSHLAHMYGSGEAFAFEGAFSGKRTSPLDLITEGETTVIFFDIEAIYNGSFERELMKGMTELLANDNIKKLYRIETLAQKGLRDRILTYLRIQSDRQASATVRTNMSRQQMAYYLCVNRSALSHELNEMQRDGIIKINKKTITLI